MIEHIDKLACDFAAALSEDDVAAAAAGIKLPTLLFSGGLSPYMAQRIVGRLASTIEGAEAHHLPAAGHMLPLTHARQINPKISRAYRARRMISPTGSRRWSQHGLESPPAERGLGRR